MTDELNCVRSGGIVYFAQCEISFTLIPTSHSVFTNEVLATESCWYKPPCLVS
jgi:hypothetical protein